MQNLLVKIFYLISFSLAISACSDVSNITNKQHYSFVNFTKYPMMHCQVVFSQGSFFGFQPPQQYDRLILNLNQLSQLKKLQFDSKRGSYIPLFDAIEIDKATLQSETEIIDLRLMSKHKNQHRIYLDIDHYNTSKSIKSRVWIVEESQILRSVLLMECEFKKLINSS